MDWDDFCGMVSDAIVEVETGMSGEDFDEREHFAALLFVTDVAWAVRNPGTGIGDPVAQAIRVALAVLAANGSEYGAPPEPFVERLVAEYRTALNVAERPREGGAGGEWAFEIVVAFALGWQRQVYRGPRTGRGYNYLPNERRWEGEHDLAGDVLDRTLEPVVRDWLLCLNEGNHGRNRLLSRAWWNHGVVGLRPTPTDEEYINAVRGKYVSLIDRCPCSQKAPGDDDEARVAWNRCCVGWHRLRSWRPERIPLWDHIRYAAGGFGPAGAADPDVVIGDFRFGLLHHVLWDGPDDVPLAPGYPLAPQPVLLLEIGPDERVARADSARSAHAALLLSDEFVIITDDICDARPGRSRPATADWNAVRRCDCGEAVVVSEALSHCPNPRCNRPLAEATDAAGWRFR